MHTTSVSLLERLRLSAPKEGSFVILRQDALVRGHATLLEAARAAETRDVIEIRSYEPFAGIRYFEGKGRALPLRASPGYRPMHTDHTSWRNDTLTIEGIHFRRARLPCLVPGMNDVVHLRNCSFEEENCGATLDGEKDSLEIVNCRVPGRMELLFYPGKKLVLTNSLLGSLRLDVVEKDLAVEITRCHLWSPVTATGRGGLTGGYFTVLARQVLFDTNWWLDHTNAWTGSGNVYRILPGTWMGSHHGSLANWCRRWNSDADSAEAEPLHYDPQQWRLLPGSPGYRQGPAGRYLGADVARPPRAAGRQREPKTLSPTKK